MNVAILGAGKIGRYHVREFTKLGAKVVAVLGSTKESSSGTAEKLKKEFGIKVRSYDRLEELLRNENLDAVSICTPPKMHENQTRKCLEHGLHVMCEKPFIQNSKDNYKAARDLFDLAEKRGKILTVNMQWASIVDYFRKYGFLSDLRKLSIDMEPEGRGIDMLKDHLPHTNSVLIKMIPDGKADEIEFLLNANETIAVKFKYQNSEKVYEIRYSFKSRIKKPSQIIFSLNGNSFRRKIGSGYRQFFVSNQYGFEIEDPLRVSISRFLEASKNQGLPLVNKKEILENMLLTEQIIKKYTSCFHKPYKSK